MFDLLGFARFATFDDESTAPLLLEKNKKAEAYIADLKRKGVNVDNTDDPEL